MKEVSNIFNRSVESFNGALNARECDSYTSATGKV